MHFIFTILILFINVTCGRNSPNKLYLGVQGEVESEGPSESECQPFIEKALRKLEIIEPVDEKSDKIEGESAEDVATVEITTDDSVYDDSDGDNDDDKEIVGSEESTEDDTQSTDKVGSIKSFIIK